MWRYHAGVATLATESLGHGWKDKTTMQSLWLQTLACTPDLLSWGSPFQTCLEAMKQTDTGTEVCKLVGTKLIEDENPRMRTLLVGILN